MKKLLLAATIAMLATSTAFAQSKMNQNDCNALRDKARASGDAWTDAEAKPYMEKMTAMKMKTKTEGKMTDDDFNTACMAGAFPGTP